MVPLVQKLGELYRNIYRLSLKISKRDRFGIHLKIENLCIDSLIFAIGAALDTYESKLLKLKSLRINIEVLKQLIRMEHEIEVIKTKTYFSIEKQLQEVSKMTNGWINYLKEKTR